MKTRNILNKYLIAPAVAAIALLAGACTEEIDTSARYTFTGQTVVSYLEGKEIYSDYVRLLKKVNISKINEEAKMYQLLTARGNYTVFAPTNEAIEIYLQSLVDEEIITTPSWDDIMFEEDENLLDSIEKVVVYNSILDGGDNTEAYQTSDFAEIVGSAELATPNMFDRRVSVRPDKANNAYIVGDSSTIDKNNCNIYVINGRVHRVDRVVALSTNSFAESIRKVIKDGKRDYYVMCNLISKCGIMDTLSKKENEQYYYDVQVGNIKVTKFKNDNTVLPEHLRIGFTLFAEDDNLWERAIGKSYTDITLEDVQNYVQANSLVPSTANWDENYTDKNNWLNLFVTYHILPERIGSKDMLVIHLNELNYNRYSNPVKRGVVSEYYTTMGQPRLMQIFESVEAHGIYINRFPELSNGRQDADLVEVSCDPECEGVLISTDGDVSLKAENVAVYKINSFLGYNDATINQMATQRIRWDVTAMFPELMTNNIRLDESKGNYYATYIPSDIEFKSRYLQNCWIEDGTQFNYLNGYKMNWLDYQGDELNIRGLYDFTMKLPPVPKDGHYELRLACQSNSQSRGMCQVYFGTNINSLPAAGIPLDMRMGGQYRRTSAGNLESIVGWVADDAEDMEANAEVDKKMRANGYMKAPKCFHMLSATASARTNADALRRIIISQDLKAGETYYIRFKSVLDDASREFFMDYMEWCPKEVYDNPSTPEDIW